MRALLLSVLLGLSVSAAAERYALLIGVSEYPALAPSLWLQGPDNDVELLRGILQKQGFTEANIRVLAGKGQTIGAPSRAAILAELERLARHTGPDDFVYLHFSGHGSQQPNTGAKDEPDGLDELFLPADIGPWNKTQARVENALIDNEIGAAVSAIRRHGTFVWAVFDSCHAGTLLRAYPLQSERSRRLRPEQLGIPVAPSRGLATATAAPLETVPGTVSQDQGGLVSFYAAQTEQETPERPLPAGHPERKTYGLFSYTLASALSRYPQASYRQLAQYILQNYAAIAGAPTPLFAGDLDATVWQREATGSSVRQWPVSKDRRHLILHAGLLDGLGRDSILAFFATPTSSEAAVLGYARVSRADPLESRLLPIAYAAKAVPELTRLPRRLYARPVALSPELGLVVAKPPSVATPHPIEQILGQLSTHTQGLRLHWVSAEQSADLRLHIAKQRLWLLPASAEWIDSGPRQSLSIDLQQDEIKLAAVLGDSLQRIAKAHNLITLGNTLLNAADTPFLTIDIELEHAVSGERERLASTDLPSLADGDILSFTLTNRGSIPADITALFIDAAYGITPWFPREPSQINRIESGARVRFRLQVVTEADDSQPATLGTEHLLVLAIQSEPGTERADYSFLAQAALPRTRGKPAGADSELDDLLLAAGFGRSSQRGAVAPRTTALERAQIQTISWRAGE